MPTLIDILAAASGLLAAPAADGQIAPQFVIESPGWNMIGGPPGVSLPAAPAIYDFQSGTYAAPTDIDTRICHGYWAYFGEGGRFPLTGHPAATSSQTCPLQAGWTMIGNPFLTGAFLPAGTTAFSWNPAENTHDTVTEVPLGGSAWVYSPTPGSVTLQGSPQETPAVVINFDPARTTPHQVHVGDRVEVRVAAVGPTSYSYSFDPAHLTMEESTAMGAEPTQYVWRWRATKAGTTVVNVIHSMGGAIPVRIDILPTS